MRRQEGEQGSIVDHDPEEYEADYQPRHSADRALCVELPGAQMRLQDPRCRGNNRVSIARHSLHQRQRGVRTDGVSPPFHVEVDGGTVVEYDTGDPFSLRGWKPVTRDVPLDTVVTAWTLEAEKREDNEDGRAGFHGFAAARQ